MERINRPVNVNQLVTHINEFRPCSDSSTRTRSRIRPVIEEIFTRFIGRYKNKFMKDYVVFDRETGEEIPEETDKNIMAEKLEWNISDLKYFTDEEIRKALNKCINEMKWPPDQAEFLEVVRSCTDLGDIDGIYRKVCCTKFYELSELERAAASKTGLFELRNNSSNQMKPIFAKNYREMFLKQRANEDLPKYLASPEEKPKNPASPDVARAHLEKIKQDLSE